MDVTQVSFYNLILRTSKPLVIITMKWLKKKSSPMNYGSNNKRKQSNQMQKFPACYFKARVWMY